jgi:hypothetical protein
MRMGHNIQPRTLAPERRETDPVAQFAVILAGHLREFTQHILELSMQDG